MLFVEVDFAKLVVILRAESVQNTPVIRSNDGSASKHLNFSQENLGSKRIFVQLDAVRQLHYLLSCIFQYGFLGVGDSLCISK